MTTQTVLQISKSVLLTLILTQLSGCATNAKPGIKNHWDSSTAPQPQTSNIAAREALQLQGHPYVPGGESPGEGFDCSGLVYYVYKKQGLALPRDTWSLAHKLPAVAIDQRQPGDLLFFTINTKPFSHVGIYVGKDKFIHAPGVHTGRVMMSDLKQPYWQERFTAVRRPPQHNSLFNSETANQLCLLN